MPSHASQGLEGRICHECPLRRSCGGICAYVERLLPSMEAARVDHEDLERIYYGKIMTHAILDSAENLPARQQEVVQLYYRENLQQSEIAEILDISQQAVADALARAKSAAGNKLKAFRTFF